MRARPSLKDIQRWVQSFIVDPAGDETLIPSNVDEAARLVLPSRTLSPVQRVGIYRGMYLLRMNEALRADFPALEHFLRDGVFEELVKKYVQVFPSRSYTLSRLREHLPEYILCAAGIPRPAFAYDLARLELAMCEVFDGPESSRLAPQAVASALANPAGESRPGSPAFAGGPEDGLEKVRLRTVEALRVLSFRYPVNDYLQSVKDETPHPRVRRKDTWLAIYRRDYTVWRLPLSRPAFSMLGALTQGRSLGAAIRAAGRGRVLLEQQVFTWFHRWVAEGLFSAVEPESSPGP